MKNRAQNYLLRLSLCVALIMAVLHISAVTFYLYDYYWWFDMPLHFLGGLWAGSFCLWFFGMSEVDILVGSKFKFPFNAFLGVLVFGVAWEFFEYHTGLTFNGTVGVVESVLDTVKDLILDIAGGYCAYLLSIYKNSSKL